MRVQYRDGVGSAVVQLDPEYLGKVTIVLETTSGGSVNATLHAASGEVRAWLQTHEQSLRHGLAEKGLSLGRLTVSEVERAEDSLARDGQERQGAQEQKRPRRPAARRGDGGTFEVVV
jgi:flagellar hook-length control protein FliK